MENEVKKSAGKVWLIPTIVAAVLLIGLVVFMVIMGKGTSALADGTVTLSEAVSPLQDGTAQLSDGVDQYTGGVDTMNEAMPTLQDGVTQYTEGVDQLNGYMKKLNDAAPALASGVKQLTDGSVKLKDGTATLTSSVKDLKTQAYGSADAIAAANKIFAAYSKGANDQEKATLAAAAIQELLAPYAEANQAGAVVVMIDTSLDMVNTNISGLKAAKAAVAAYAANTADNAKRAAAIKALMAVNPEAAALEPFANENYSILQIILGDTTQQVMIALSQGALNQTTAATLQTAYTDSGHPAHSTATTTIDAMVAGVEEKIVGAEATIDGSITALNGMVTELNKQKATYAPIAEQRQKDAVPVITKVVTVMCGYAGTANNIDALLKGCNDLNAGAVQLSDGLVTLNSNVNGKEGLVASVKQLYKDGSNKLAENSEALRDGVKQLADGAKQLSENSQALRDGASQLKDAAPALIDGIGQLVDGAKKVNGFTPIH